MEMANYLKIKSPSITAAEKRGFFPLEWAVKIALAFDINIKWLLTGEGQPGATPEPATPEPYKFVIPANIKVLIPGVEDYLQWKRRAN